eukprot:1898938-Pyramimonas_sp.AAC.1
MPRKGRVLLLWKCERSEMTTDGSKNRPNRRRLKHRQPNYPLVNVVIVLDFFAALPGFKVHPFYDDFSTPCFDGQHNVIMGGSWVSSGQLASLFARYHFRPHFFQHAGFRMVKSSHQPILTSMDAPPPHAAGKPILYIPIISIP